MKSLRFSNRVTANFKILKCIGAFSATRGEATRAASPRVGGWGDLHSIGLRATRLPSPGP